MPTEEPANKPTDDVPVEPGEAILRLIHKVYHNAALPTPVQPEAFRPTANDADGLSVFRERFVSSVELLETVPPEKRDLYYVARLTVVELAALGLEVVPDPIDAPQGHALIPLLSLGTYQNDKVAGKVIQKQLADLASRGIVQSPPQDSGT